MAAHAKSPKASEQRVAADEDIAVQFIRLEQELPWLAAQDSSVVDKCGSDQHGYLWSTRWWPVDCARTVTRYYAVDREHCAGRFRPDVAVNTALGEIGWRPRMDLAPGDRDCRALMFCPQSEAIRPGWAITDTTGSHLKVAWTRRGCLTSLSPAVAEQGEPPTAYEGEYYPEVRTVDLTSLAAWILARHEFLVTVKVTKTYYDAGARDKKPESPLPLSS